MKPHPSFGEAFRFWLKLGFISFGGPTGQIAIMHTELVEQRRWIGEQRFLHALNYCMLLPGPEATQLATYCGWLLHGTWGGIVAGVLFVLPAALLLWLLSYIYVAFGQIAWIAALFGGLKPAVTAIVAAATIRIGQRALKTRPMWLLAAVSFVALFVFEVPFPAIVAGAAAMGWLGGWFWPAAFTTATGPVGASSGTVVDDAQTTVDHARPTFARALRVSAVCLALWWTPVIVAALAQGWSGTLARQGLFFSKAAMVTFGGAYAVLPYVGQQAVDSYQWLTAPQMLDGLGLAETTPGPLIMVVQFVGFLGGWNHPGALSPLLSATLAAALTTWTTFVPCFYWISLGAPYIERMRGNVAVNRTLTAVTAAVVGVVANLAVWFAQHALFPGFKFTSENSADGYRLHYQLGADVFSIAVAIAAFVALHRFRVGLVPVIAACAAVGLVRHLL
ncbi:chromate transporter [Opitutaceae bacterium EW11]|nr:chromate transporter [Opitutaceae bacterium EW11]